MLERINYFSIKLNVKNCFVIRVNCNMSLVWEGVKFVPQGPTVFDLCYIQILCIELECTFLINLEPATLI